MISQRLTFAYMLIQNIKPSSHLARAFAIASNVKNGVFGNKW